MPPEPPQGVMMMRLRIAGLLLFLCLLFVPRLQDERALYLIVSLSVLFTSLGMEWLYKALEQYSYITIRSIAFKLIALLAMFALVHAKQDYRIYGAISIFAISASGVMNFIHARRYISMRPVGHYDLRRHLKAVLVFHDLSPSRYGHALVHDERYRRRLL